eukprot:GSChrysophyteH1.ASY1.ANO1.1280.1 assembled CDS
MGGSVSFSYWTAEEEEENQKALTLQETAKKFILEYMYYGIPVRSGKSSHDPRSPLWVEIDPGVLEKAHLGKGDIKMNLIETVPSSVSVNSKGVIRVLFISKINIEYSLHVDDFIEAQKYEDPDAPASAPSYVPVPEPPVLLRATQNSLALFLKLPQPAGISQQLELQYAPITPKIYRKTRDYIARLYELTDTETNIHSLLNVKSENRDVYRVVNGENPLGKCPFQWNTLSTRMYYKPGFQNFTLEKLLPGDCYVFRLRYMNHLAWSAFSYPSHIVETLPAPPSMPDAPICGFVSSTSIQLFWVPPLRDNGSPIKDYVLRGKSAGGDFVELFQGKNCSYLATELHPDFIYSFEVAANNSSGISEWSRSISVTTSKSTDRVRPRDPDSFEWIMALQFRDAWRELWDPKTENTFYFNTITGTRQLELPEALQTDIDDHEFEDCEDEFRKKRYRLLRTLHSLRSKPDAEEQQTKSIEIRRSHLLLDGFRKFTTAAPVDISKRFKFSFTGEPGIDSGGVGKELFLLLSRQAVLYASDSYRGKYKMEKGARRLSDQCVDDMAKINAGKFFKFLGRLLGKAVYDRQLVDVPMSTLLLKHMLGQNLQAKGNHPQIKDLDSDMYMSLKWMAKNEITDVLYEKFSVGIIERKVALCAGGENMDVTEENKDEYIKLLIEWKTHYAVNHHLEPFLTGFHELVPLHALRECSIETNELSLLLNGKESVDVDELRAYCIYQGATESSPWDEETEIVVWLWQALRDLSQNEIRSIICFFTGSARVPLDGYDPPLNITQGVDMDPNSLPRSHTCFNQLVLPPFDSYEMLKERLVFAAKETEGFNLA